MSAAVLNLFIWEKKNPKKKKKKKSCQTNQGISSITKVLLTNAEMQT